MTGNFKILAKALVVIWAGNLSWDLIGDVPWYGGRDFVGDWALKTPCPAGKLEDISGGFVRFYWTRVGAVPASAWVPGGRRCKMIGVFKLYLFQKGVDPFGESLLLYLNPLLLQCLYTTLFKLRGSLSSCYWRHSEKSRRNKCTNYLFFASFFFFLKWHGIYNWALTAETKISFRSSAADKISPSGCLI